MTALWQAITTALIETVPEKKCELVNQLYDDLLPTVNLTELDDFPIVTPTQDIAGFPHKPALVAPKDVPKRSFATKEGYAATLHAIAHIEFNAINLGLRCLAFWTLCSTGIGSRNDIRKRLVTSGTRRKYAFYPS